MKEGEEEEEIAARDRVLLKTGSDIIYRCFCCAILFWIPGVTITAPFRATENMHTLRRLI